MEEHHLPAMIMEEYQAMIMEEVHILEEDLREMIAEEDTQEVTVEVDFNIL